MCSGGKAPKAQPPAEPMKNAETATRAAEDSTARAQALRRGMMGLYTRYAAQSGGMAAAGDAAGMAAKADKIGG